MENNHKKFPANKVYFNDEQTEFIRENYKKLTNRQLASRLGVTLTVLRIYKYSLGLFNVSRPIGWSAGETRFLIENYQRVGNVELAEQLNDRYAYKNRNFKQKHVRQKLKILGLQRTNEEIESIIIRNAKQGRYNTNKNIAPKANFEKVLNTVYTGQIAF